MARNRLTYQNWIVELGFDPLLGQESEEPVGGDGGAAGAFEHDDRVARIREAVQVALTRLSEDEREMIERLHFMGQTIPELARSSGRARHKLEAMYTRAVRQLRRELSPLVREMYGLESGGTRDCPICASPHRAAIDRIIAARDPTATWRPVIQEIRRRFGIKLRAPQVLIGHYKYHS